MELKTQICAEDGKQEILITREFDLPVELLFRAYTEPEIIEQWMGNKVLKMENHNHGSYEFETKNAEGNVVFSANGTIHKIIPNRQIIRTFEMQNTSFPVQLEFLEFKSLSDKASKLTIHMIYKSVEDRDQMLKLPFAQGINMAHNKLEKILSQLK